jgi:hypothetical protein
VGCSIVAHELYIDVAVVFGAPEGVEEEEGIRRSGSKEQVEVTHQAKGGVYGVEEMRTFH